MKLIPISKTTLFAVVDDEDYDKLSQNTWYLNNGYALRSHDGIRMHHDVLNVNNFTFEEVHHINNNKLDNRRSNLKMLEFSVHQATKPPQSNNVSGYKGVSWKNPQSTRKGKWVAQIAYNRRKIHIGYFISALEAAKAYDNYAIQIFGPDAFLNFPKNETT